MRNHLFKAKMKHDGEWMRGVPVDVTPLSCFEVLNKEFIMVRAGFADWGMPRNLEGAKVDPDTICEYSSFNDKAEKEIFEGDILKIDYVSTGCNFVLGIVELLNGSFVVKFKDEHYELLCQHYKNSEVVGNIFDEAGCRNEHTSV